MSDLTPTQGSTFSSRRWAGGSAFPVFALARRRPDTPWREPLTCPAVWTRQWSEGRVFVSTIGHKLVDLAIADITTMTQRGLLWASR
jgi:type 1 glutamine amidotransferase